MPKVGLTGVERHRRVLDNNGGGFISWLLKGLDQVVKYAAEIEWPT